MEQIKSGVEKSRHREGLLAAIATALFFAIPLFFSNLYLYSIANQIMVAIPATLSVYLMLRMNLLSFAVPAFMCLGGFASAILSLHVTTNLGWLLLVSFIFPAVVALPLGAMVLRLRGVYFVLVTFILSEIMQLLLFELPSITGGANGLANLPPVTLAGTTLSSNRAVLSMAIFIAVVATLATFLVTRMIHRQIDAIYENELLARSLGLVSWHYKALCFAIAAGLAGLAGFSLVSMLLTAHPSSFNGLAGVSYVAYLFVGGQLSLLGPLVGSTLLITLSNLFSASGEYSTGFFGLAVMVIVLIARSGVVGAVKDVFNRRCRMAVPRAVASSKTLIEDGKR